MTIQSTTLRPGLLVSLRTSVTGNVSYDKRIIEADHVTADGEARAKWETVRTITDPAEHERAEKARSAASAKIRAVCARSAFGLLCPESDSDDLAAAMREARAIADEFNASAALSRVSVYIIAGRIAADDVEAVKAINSEISELLADMAQGVQNLDAEAIRAAANKAKNVGAMLPAEASARVQVAIEAARSAARQIVKAGEQASSQVDQRAIRKITEARTAFLDLQDAGEIQAPAAQARAVDLEPATAVAAVAVPTVPQFDLSE